MNDLAKVLRDTQVVVNPQAFLKEDRIPYGFLRGSLTHPQMF